MAVCGASGKALIHLTFVSSETSAAVVLVPDH